MKKDITMMLRLKQNKRIRLSLRYCVIVGILVFLTATGSTFAQEKQTNLKEKQTGKPAIVFLVAGQSNAGGCGVFSPEVHEKFGRHKTRPLVLGSDHSP